ncbi:hypothetical protein ACQUSR_02490 [Streptomyces sp. P1-3]|uniref:hypothetical protein n=1 Tax=Streptomyces sp. P1-3 TaxID=3421658 RepID=UPI003D35F15E
MDVDDVLTVAAEKHGFGLEARLTELVEEADHLVEPALGARQRDGFRTGLPGRVINDPASPP